MVAVRCRRRPGALPALLLSHGPGRYTGIGWLYPLGTPDSSIYPAEVRPLNRYIAADAQKDKEIGIYQDPSDRTWDVGFVGSPGAAGIDDHAYGSWQVWGSSYTLNTRFMQGPTAPGGIYATLSRFIAPHLNGGKASRFIMWTEQAFYSLCNNARATLAASTANPQRNGWHREFSKWCNGFADGHVRYGYFDNRVSIAPDGSWTIWKPK